MVRDQCKIVWNSNSLCIESPKLAARFIGRMKAKSFHLPFCISGNNIPENTWFPVQQVGCRVVEFCKNSPEAGSLVLKSYETVHLFLTHREDISSRCWFLRLTSLKNSTSSSTETWKCLQGEETAHMVVCRQLVCNIWLMCGRSTQWVFYVSVSQW